VPHRAAPSASPLASGGPSVGPQRRHAVAQQRLVGGDQRRRFGVGLAGRAELGVEHQGKGVRLLVRKAHVGQAQRQQPLARRRGARHGVLLRPQKAPQALGADGLQQAVAVGEVMVGRGVTDARGAGPPRAG
jgi:hypothetical protein